MWQKKRTKNSVNERIPEDSLCSPSPYRDGFRYAYARSFRLTGIGYVSTLNSMFCLTVLYQYIHVDIRLTGTTVRLYPLRNSQFSSGDFCLLGCMLMGAYPLIFPFFMCNYYSMEVHSSLSKIIKLHVCSFYSICRFLWDSLCNQRVWNHLIYISYLYSLEIRLFNTKYRLRGGSLKSAMVLPVFTCR